MSEKKTSESVDKIIANRMSKAYSEWKVNQDTQSFNENIRRNTGSFCSLSRNKRESAYGSIADEIFAEQKQKVFLSLGYKRMD